MDRHEQVLRRRRGGFTLLETAVSTALFGVMLASFYTFLFSQGNAVFEEDSELHIQGDLRRTMDAIISELDDAKLVYLETTGSFIRYQTPQIGTTGLPQVDTNGNLVMGAYDQQTFYVNGYYEMRFVDSARPEDQLVESLLKVSLTDNGQNLNQDYVAGTSTDDMGDAFVYGQFWVQTYSVAGNVNSTTAGDALGQVGPFRVLPGQCLRQYDKNSATTPPATSPDAGGFFYMRNPQGSLLYNSSGGTTGTLTWGPQKSEPFTDANGNGTCDASETYQDLNSNNQWEEPDCEPFIDADGNNVLSGNEKYTDTNGNGRWDACLKIQLRVFDSRRIASRSDDPRFKFSRIRMLQTKSKLRNGF